MIRIKTAIGILTTIVMTNSCFDDSRQKDGIPCNCLETISTSEKTFLSVENIPKDLTTITTQIKTTGLFARKIETLGNQLFKSEYRFEERDKRWQIIEDEIDNWLGGPYNGDCGNLAKGHSINDFDYFGNSIDIEIKTTDIKLHIKNTDPQTAPYFYQGYINFQIMIKTNDSRVLTGSIDDNYLGFSSCTKYINVE